MSDKLKVDYKTTFGPITLILTCGPSLLGSPNLTLEDDSKLLSFRFPAKLWPWIQPGNKIIMTFAPVKVDAQPEVMSFPMDPKVN